MRRDFVSGYAGGALRCAGGCGPDSVLPKMHSAAQGSYERRNGGGAVSGSIGGAIRAPGKVLLKERRGTPFFEAATVLRDRGGARASRGLRKLGRAQRSPLSDRLGKDVAGWQPRFLIGEGLSGTAGGGAISCQLRPHGGRRALPAWPARRCRWVCGWRRHPAPDQGAASVRPSAGLDLGSMAVIGPLCSAVAGPCAGLRVTGFGLGWLPLEDWPTAPSLLARNASPASTGWLWRSHRQRKPPCCITGARSSNRRGCGPDAAPRHESPRSRGQRLATPAPALGGCMIRPGGALRSHLRVRSLGGVRVLPLCQERSSTVRVWKAAAPPG